MVPYALLIIKPMSVGRGDAPKILEDILEHCPVSLRLFRAWTICETTLMALTQDKGPHRSSLDYEAEKIHPPRQVASWVCIFTHLDRQSDPTSLLEDYCGGEDANHWSLDCLRYRYSSIKTQGRLSHSSDTVVHIASPPRVQYESNLLFLQFNEDIL